jgi:NodT family efflux transporter outer membrane factor (OMF) lipoprotein
MLVGCAGGRVREADIRLPATFEAPAPAQPAPTAALDQWWRLYDDVQLTQLVEQALADSPDAKDAASKLVQARAVRAAALLSYNPQGSLSASATKQQYNLLEPAAKFAQAESGSAALLGSGLGGSSSLGGSALSLTSTETGQAAFSVSWELDLFGRRQAAKKSADADLRAAQFDAAATRWSLSADVADSLFQARGLALQLAEAQSTLRDEQQLFDIAKAKVEHGLTPASDRSQAESNLETAQAQAESLDAQLTAARRSLLLLVGRGVDPLASLPIPADVGAPPPVPATLPGALLVRRPDVLEARQRVVSAAGKLTLDQRALLPTFTLQPGVGLLQETASAASRLSFWSLGANAAVPVLDRPRLLAVARQQNAVAEQAVIAYEKSVQTAYGDAETAFVYFASDGRRLAMLRSAEQSANSAYQAKLTGYKRGLNDLQATLTAEATWRQARVARASAETTLMQRSVQVFKALGGGWTPVQVAG